MNANGLGWYLFLWQEKHNKVDDYDPKAIVAKSFSETLVYKRKEIYGPRMSLIIDPQAIIKELEVLGFAKIETSNEGGLFLDQTATVLKSFFKIDYNNYSGICEVVAFK